MSFVMKSSMRKLRNNRAAFKGRKTEMKITPEEALIEFKSACEHWKRFDRGFEMYLFICRASELLK